MIPRTIQRGRLGGTVVGVFQSYSPPSLVGSRVDCGTSVYTLLSFVSAPVSFVRDPISLALPSPKPPPAGAGAFGLGAPSFDAEPPLRFSLDRRLNSRRGKEVAKV